MEAAIAAYNRDLEDAEVTYADIVVDDGRMSTVPSSSSQHKGKYVHDNNQLPQSPQKRGYESGELLKGVTQPQPTTATAVFANYVHDSLVIMSKRKFRKARSRINTILSELMDEESDEEEPPNVATILTAASVLQRSIPATNTHNVSEMYQPQGSSSVWDSQTADYMVQYI